MENVLDIDKTEEEAAKAAEKEETPEIIAYEVAEEDETQTQTQEEPAEDSNTEETADETEDNSETEETADEAEDNSETAETEDETEEDSDTEETADEAGEDGDDFAPTENDEADDGGDEPPAEDAKEKKPFPIKKILKISGIVIGALAVIYIAGVWFYSSHFFFNTKIGGVNCSNLSPAAAAERIKTGIDGYSLNIVYRDESSEQIAGSDISLAYAAIGNLNDVKKRQNPLLWATDYTTRHLNVDIDISYDETALLEKLKALRCVSKSDAAMVGATENVHYDSDSMKYWVEETGSPDIVSINKILEKAKLCIAGLYKDINLEAEGCYVGAADEDNMHSALETLNRYVSTKVTYTCGDKQPYLDGGSINEWLTLNDDYTVTLDAEALKTWVGDLSGILNTVGSTRNFVTNSGETVTVSGGDYGWKVDVDKETEELKGVLEEGGEHEREPVYSQTAGDRGPNNDLPNTYVEVSISAQHVWFYKDGEVIVSTDCVTGDVVRSGRSTHTGTYYVKYKERNATLKGEDYETPVSFWMPFNGGEGLHDATWRGSFGGSIYRGGGSHGCVNLPYSAAQKLYENVERGVPVIVY